MAEIHHFTYGWVTPVLAYALSVLGSLLGLMCAGRVRDAASPGRRAWWLILAAWAIGGTGIWVMHFMAMLGFAMVGSDIRYDVPITAGSAATAITVVGIGLFIVGMGKLTALRLGVGGLITGLGVNAMHYMGMAAVRVDGHIHYDQLKVGASIAIAVIAATVALWLAVNVRGGAATFGAALVMGVAVCGMHYTGMSAMSVENHESGELRGATASALLIPIVLAVIFVMVAMVYAVLAVPNEEDRAGAAYINARMADRLNGSAPAEAEPAPLGRRPPRTSFPSIKDMSR